MAARVAVIGARGIGRHHANWWRLEGAEVCAFAGTSPESAACTQAQLEQAVGFKGAGYVDVQTMLDNERPDFVDVCSPAPLHAEHVLRALESGCHVLCEKPFVYDPWAAHELLLAQAQDLINFAQYQGRQLGVCTQYSAGTPYFQSLWKTLRQDTPITFYRGHLEAPAKGRPADPVRIWTDLAPHILSVILAWFPDAEPLWNTLHTRFSGYEAAASLTLHTGAGTVVACEFYTRNRTEDPPNIRRFTFNDCTFQVDAGRDAEGAFCARIAAGDIVMEQPDMMRLLIRGSLHGSPTVTGAPILKNLAWMLRILDHATA